MEYFENIIKKIEDFKLENLDYSHEINKIIIFFTDLEKQLNILKENYDNAEYYLLTNQSAITASKEDALATLESENTITKTSFDKLKEDINNTVEDTVNKLNNKINVERLSFNKQIDVIINEKTESIKESALAFADKQRYIKSLFPKIREYYQNKNDETITSFNYYKNQIAVFFEKVKKKYTDQIEDADIKYSLDKNSIGYKHNMQIDIIRQKTNMAFYNFVEINKVTNAIIADENVEYKQKIDKVDKEYAQALEEVTKSIAEQYQNKAVEINTIKYNYSEEINNINNDYFEKKTKIDADIAKQAKQLKNLLSTIQSNNSINIQLKKSNKQQSVYNNLISQREDLVLNRNIKIKIADTKEEFQLKSVERNYNLLFEKYDLKKKHLIELANIKKSIEEVSHEFNMLPLKSINLISKNNLDKEKRILEEEENIATINKNIEMMNLDNSFDVFKIKLNYSDVEHTEQFNYLLEKNRLSKQKQLEINCAELSSRILEQEKIIESDRDSFNYTRIQEETLRLLYIDKVNNAKDTFTDSYNDLITLEKNIATQKIEIEKHKQLISVINYHKNKVTNNIESLKQEISQTIDIKDYTIKNFFVFLNDYIGFFNLQFETITNLLKEGMKITEIDKLIKIFFESANLLRDVNVHSSKIIKDFFVRYISSSYFMSFTESDFTKYNKEFFNTIYTNNISETLTNDKKFQFTLSELSKVDVYNDKINQYNSVLNSRVALFNEKQKLLDSKSKELNSEIENMLATKQSLYKRIDEIVEFIDNTNDFYYQIINSLDSFYSVINNTKADLKENIDKSYTELTNYKLNLYKSNNDINILNKKINSDGNTVLDKYDLVINNIFDNIINDYKAHISYMEMVDDISNTLLQNKSEYQINENNKLFENDYNSKIARFYEQNENNLKNLNTLHSEIAALKEYTENERFLVEENFNNATAYVINEYTEDKKKKAADLDSHLAKVNHDHKNNLSGLKKELGRSVSGVSEFSLYYDNIMKHIKDSHKQKSDELISKYVDLTNKITLSTLDLELIYRKLDIQNKKVISKMDKKYNKLLIDYNSNISS
ncbi:MAG: hypothetical protein LBV51_06055 [Acholeplasmatales bacterium]|jgi:hypothetical protein|nr:hypothetical protein [Acholeplasmatales bacterium]